MGALALVALIVAGTHGETPLYLHEVYFLVDTPMTVLFLAVLAVAACFAVFRLSQHSLNRGLGLIGVTLALLACSVFLLVSASEKWYWPFHNWQIYSLSVGVYCFLLGSILVSASVIWTLSWTLYRTIRHGSS